MTNQIIVGGKDLYELPAPLSFTLFEDFQNAAILQPDENSSIHNGRSVIDSVNLAGSRSDKQKLAEVVEMITRHGGYRVGDYNPNSAVA